MTAMYERYISLMYLPMRHFLVRSSVSLTDSQLGKMGYPLESVFRVISGVASLVFFSPSSLSPVPLPMTVVHKLITIEGR
jgi:hypothetical protein